MRRKTGQSILEYIIVLTAVIGGIVFALTTFAQQSATTGLGAFYSKAGDTLGRATNGIGNAQ